MNSGALLRRWGWRLVWRLARRMMILIVDEAPPLATAPAQNAMMRTRVAHAWGVALSSVIARASHCFSVRTGHDARRTT